MTSNKFSFLEWTVWYEKFGAGPNPLLLIPGALGTGLSDFRQQLIGENALNQSVYTIIAVEPLGWGRSRPPARPYGKNLYSYDADCCLQLMKSLGFDKFSIIGWSDGGITGLLMASVYPDCVQSLVLSSVPAFPSKHVKNFLLRARDINTWNQRDLNNYYLVYDDDHDLVQQLWTNHVNFVQKFTDYYPNGGFDDRFDLVRCPVFIIHGDKDPLVEMEQPLKVQQLIKGAKLYRFRSGGHSVHQTNAEEFKSLVENFIDQTAKNTV